MHVPEGFMPPYLSKFYGCSDPYNHVSAINTQLTIIRVLDTLKCKLLSVTFRDATLQWYMDLPQASNANYQKLEMKLRHQFIFSRHKKMSTTSFFNIQ